MKINLNLIKNWLEENIDTDIIINKLTDLGFESFIEKNIINVSIPTNRVNSENLISILKELSKFFKVKTITNHYIKNSKKKYKIKIFIKNKEFCPIYCYAIIEEINNNIETPKNIEEHLTINGIKTHNFIIDILNFSTLITGQPLHAYDLNKIKNDIIIEKSIKNTTINSINDTKIIIKKNDLIIRDNNKILSLAGKIGASSSKIDKNTTAILIESAYFNEKTFKNNFGTLSSNLFKERINLNLIKPSIIYAINLINNSQETNNSEIIEKIYKKYIPKNKYINLNKTYLEKFSGINEKNTCINTIFTNTDITFKNLKKSWKFTIPFHRKDIQIKENLIAEIIKFFGYNEIKAISIKNEKFNINKIDYRNKSNKEALNKFLLSNGFNEIITYSFVDKTIESSISNKEKIIDIKNPMSENNNVLRTSLLQGLIKTFKTNINRGNEKVKLFEIGNTYEKVKNKIITKNKLACICEENDIIQNNKNYSCDINFFIIKKLIENITENIFKNNTIDFKTNLDKIYFDKNISAEIFLNNNIIGEIGLLEKNFLTNMAIKNNIYFFQLDLDIISKNKKIKKIKQLSKFPKIKRDISIITNNDEPFLKIKNYIKNLMIPDLKNIKFMNVFELEKKEKSINLRLTFQNKKKTLTDTEINNKTFFILDMINKNFKKS